MRKVLIKSFGLSLLTGIAVVAIFSISGQCGGLQVVLCHMGFGFSIISLFPVLFILFLVQARKKH